MRLKKTRLFYLAVAVIFTMVQMVPAMAEETQEFVIDEDGVLTAYNGEDTVVEIETPQSFRRSSVLYNLCAVFSRAFSLGEVRRASNDDSGVGRVIFYKLYHNS